MAAAVGFIGLFSSYFLSVVLAAIFRTKLFAPALGVFLVFFKRHFTGRTLFFEKIKHIFWLFIPLEVALATESRVPSGPLARLLLTGFI